MIINLLECICFNLLVLLNAFASDSIASIEPPQPRLFHIAPKSIPADSVTTLSCVIEDGKETLKTIKIFLHTDQEEFIKEIPLTYQRGAYVVKLIPEMLQGKFLFYFFLAEFNDGRLVALPSENPGTEPYRVPILAAPK